MRYKNKNRVLIASGDCRGGKEASTKAIIVPKNYICTAFSVKNFSLKMCFFKSNSKQLMKHKSMESFKSQCKFGFIKDHLPET